MRYVLPLMLSLMLASIAGCASDGSFGCLGREPIILSPATAAVMTREEKEAVVATNEALERECGVKPLALGDGGA